MDEAPAELNPKAEEMLDTCRRHLKEAEDLLDYIISIPGLRTEKNTLVSFNELGLHRP